MGKLFVISGPSGVGKSTICKAVVDRIADAYLSVSLTTRPQKRGEENGREYWFVSRDEFEKKLEHGQFLEYAQVFGNYYGTLKDKIDDALVSGKKVVLEIDVQGGKQVKLEYPDAELIFILPPTEKDLVKRLNGRGREGADEAMIRLNGAGTEIAAAFESYNHMVINDDLEQAIDEVVAIVKS